MMIIQKLNACKNLEELRDLLNEINGLDPDDHLVSQVKDKLGQLPTYSPNMPAGLWGIYSWDDNNILVYSCGEWIIEPRE